MTWKNFISRRLIGSRRRSLATATLYGLSLAVRFTSATGEEVEIPAHAMHPVYPLVFIMTRDGSGLPYQDWGRGRLCRSSFAKVGCAKVGHAKTGHRVRRYRAAMRLNTGDSPHLFVPSTDTALERCSSCSRTNFRNADIKE
ncbi:hypothetical protein [Bradyrhizobium symbiodeficiens]|uniref:hypothetical protein n=1 Tax=Bradyrhizobium symbiodeficiens TaxID=1404367 RepID=UPI002FE60FB9